MPTVGLNVESLDFKGINWTFWDVGGQATKLWKHYFESVNAIIFVIDATDESRLLKARDELHRVCRDEALRGLSVLIFLNKSDIVDKKMSVEFVHTHMDIEALEAGTGTESR